ncbi:MAG: hypothetical protein NTU63_02575 [Candidatus Pacearchaeota archaeon]|nr:hypothetical protein [Candidatus Pacearchaeota archaeon]
MKTKTALKIILIISILGVLFSGFLSYFELFAGTCPIGGRCTLFLNLPACLYGLVMYFIILFISIFGITHKEHLEVEEKQSI